MCGIWGIIKSNNSIDEKQLIAMTRVLRHRGLMIKVLFLQIFKEIFKAEC